MNIVKVYGGLGNQMFQWAFGYLLEKKGHVVAYDTTWFNKPSDPPRPYGLPSFTLPSLRQAEKIPTMQTIHENGYMPEVLEKDNCFLFGYWQYLPYYEAIFSELRTCFKLREEIWTKHPGYMDCLLHIRQPGTIVLHVRRGDYVTVNGHILLPFKYYMQALQMFPDASEIFIFSDDLEWCKAKFLPEYLPFNVNFVDFDDILAMDLMRYATYYIIANSTFSWWGAMLNDNPHKQVVAPQRWRVDPIEQKKMENGLFVPLDWKRI